MAWELFTQVGSKFKSRASISANGSISFTQGVGMQFNINKDTSPYAKLYYDKDTKRIGIEFVQAEDNHTIKTNFRDDTGFWFSGKAFLTVFDIMPKTTNLYEIEKSDNLLVIKLDTARARKTKDKTIAPVMGELPVGGL